jgi:hypothetical protein
MYRKKGYIIARIVGLLAVLLMAFIVAIQTPLVQTRLSKFALNQLVAIMDGRVHYDEIKVMTSGVIVIRNVKLIDTHPYAEDINGRGWAPADTVAHIDKLTATFGLETGFESIATLGIGHAETDSPTTATSMFDLSGRKMPANVQLRRGLYIINGQKVYIR